VKKATEKSIQDQTDEEIAQEIDARKRELDRRAEERRKAKIAQSRAWSETLQKEFDLGALDALIPEHSMETCTDKNTKNGLDSDYDGEPARCARCCLLEIVRGEADWKLLDRILVIDVSVRLSKH
jgi:hypothetical protein